MAAGDPTSALQWVGIALAVSTDSRQLGNEGRLMYLRGRCYQLHMTQALDEHAMDDCGAAETASASTVSASGMQTDREKYAGRYPTLVFVMSSCHLLWGGGFVMQRLSAVHRMHSSVSTRVGFVAHMYRRICGGCGVACPQGRARFED